jgi:hypothetical protein
MANSKISALTSATTPLAGTEVLPIVQSSATTQVTVANLTAGRSVSGANFVVTSATIPANGVYLSGTNSVGIATNSTLRATVIANGSLLLNTTTQSGGAGGFTVAVTSSGAITTPIAMRNAGTANGSGARLSFRGLTSASAEADYAYLNMVADDTTAKTGSIRFATVNGASPVDVSRFDNAGNLQMQAGAVMPYAPAPTGISAAATLTNADIQGQIISATGTTYTITMPLGTTMETLASWATTNIGYDFFVINTATGIITMAVNTGVTSLGLLTIAAATSAHFRIRRTAANTFVLYRLS